MVPEGRLHMRPFQFHLKVSPQGALVISSVVGHPPSLDRTISAHLEWWQNPTNAECRPSSQRPQYPTLYRCLKGWGAHSEQTSTKSVWLVGEKGLHIHVLELKAVSLALHRCKDQCQNKTVLVATDNSTVVVYINSDASRARDTRYLASYSTSPQFGIFGAFGRRRDPACLQNGGAPIVSAESFNFIIMKAIFRRFFSVKNVISYENKMDTTVWKWMMQTSDTNNNTVEPVHTACVLPHIFS